MTEPYREPDEERQRALEREQLAAEELKKRPGRLARNALLLSFAAIVAPIAIGLSFRSADSSAAAFLFFLGSGLGTSGVVLGAFVLFRFRRPRIGTLISSVIAILLGLVAWPCALFVCFVAAGGAGAPGRPLRVAGIRILPRVRARPTSASKRASWTARTRTPRWSRRRPATDSAKLWLADARAEHASVTAFERLAADLIAVGAPEHLVEWTRRAARDEVGHATMCFTVASAYAGRELRASPVPFVPSRRRSGARVLRDRNRLFGWRWSSLLDGGIEEGIAAKSARDRRVSRGGPRDRESRRYRRSRRKRPGTPSSATRSCAGRFVSSRPSSPISWQP